MIDGPRLAPVHSPARRLVVILHGYGADGSDLIGLGGAWREALPDATFIAPDAPQVCDHMPDGRQWFPLDLRDPHEYWTGCLGARPALDAFLDRELASLGLSDRDLALVGFSQGCMMALHVGLRRPAAPRIIIGYSGRLAGPDRLAGISARPPVTLIHGGRDAVIPAAHMEAGAQALRAAGLTVHTHLLADADHEITPVGAGLGLAAIATAFGDP